MERSAGDREVSDTREYFARLTQYAKERPGLIRLRKEYEARVREENRIYARQARWNALRAQLKEDRHARLEQAIIKSIGQREWEWFEERLHDDCY